MKKHFFLTLIAMLFVLSQVSYSNPDWDAWGKGEKNELSTVPVLAALGEDLYAGTANGLFKYTRLVYTWTEIDNGIKDKNIVGIEFKGTDIYVITSTAGVFKSIDDGVTWTEINNGLTFKETSRILINGEDIYIGTNGGGVFLSNNNGDSWTDLSSGLSAEQKKIASLAVIGNNLFIGTFKEGILVTSDKGANWKTVNNGLDYHWVHSMGVIGNSLYAAVNDETKTSGCGVFISYNNGESWSNTNFYFTKDRISSLYAGSDGDYWGSKNITIGTSGGKILWSRDDEFWWKDISKNLPSSKIMSISYTNQNSLLYASTENEGIFSLFTIGTSVETKTESVLNVSPNPAGDFITISAGSINPTLKRVLDEVYIYNTLGEKVMFVGAGHDLSSRINISDLPKGMYFVKVGIETTKFVKM